MLLPEQIDFQGSFPRLSRRLRLGVVGGGRISRIQAMAARLSDHWEIVAGALSSDPSRTKSEAATWFLPEERCYSSYQEMARHEAARADGVDAVMITTPNHLHFACAKAFLEVGINVLCDKPMTNETKEAQELIKLVQNSGCVFGVSYVMSCFAMVRQARELVASGKIGQINQIHVEFMQDWMTPAEIARESHVKWRLDPGKSGRTSCVSDIGTHAAHLAQFVSGLSMSQLRADFHVCGAPKPLEDTVFMNTRYRGDVPGTLIATRLAPGNRGGLRLRIYGSEGGLEWDLEKSEIIKFNRFGEMDRVLTRGHGHGILPKAERHIRSARGFAEGIIEAWGNLYTEFAMAVAARQDKRTIPHEWLQLPSVEEGANGVFFVEAAVQSNEAGGQWIVI